MYFYRLTCVHNVSGVLVFETIKNKTVIDRGLVPVVTTLEVTLSARK